jgi:hypothetical protein
MADRQLLAARLVAETRRSHPRIDGNYRSAI